MKSSKNIIVLMFLLISLTSIANARDLTGIWQSDGIGTALGTYYIRVSEDDVFWMGESSDAAKTWCNVFHGTMKDNIIKGKWVDLLVGASGGAGTLELQYDPQKDIIFLNKETGMFSGRKWIRLER